MVGSSNFGLLEGLRASKCDRVVKFWLSGGSKGSSNLGLLEGLRASMCGRVIKFWTSGRSEGLKV